MYKIVKRITEGRGQSGDIDMLERLSTVVATVSLCGLGKTAANPVLSTLRYFRNEYTAHINQKRCPAVVCKEIISSPCQHTCPINTEAQVYITYVARQRFQDALTVITRENPMPATVSRICHHPCERIMCRASELGAPIGIRAIKRFVIDWARDSKIEMNRVNPGPDTGKKVAIIGSGPAGLSAGYYLRLKGHEVTIFEARDRPGGMLWLGVPEYRLPRAVLEFDVATMRRTGINIETNTEVGRDITLEGILEKGYEAVFVTVGAHESIKMKIPGEDHVRVMPAMEFLTKVHSGEEVELGKKVCVIGGGNSAIDASRVARRLGCDVTIFYRRTRAEMTAFVEEIEGALEEGVRLVLLVAPKRIMAQNGQLHLEVQRMRLGEYDRSGRRRPTPVEGSEFVEVYDTIISAIGERPNTGFLKESVELTEWGTIKVDPSNLMTSRRGMFAGGDAIRGPSTAIEAIADGKKAAEAIHNFLNGKDWHIEYKVTRPTEYLAPVEIADDEIDAFEHVEMPRLPVEDRISNFNEIELGYSAEMAIREARRCLRCDLDTDRGREYIDSIKKETNG